MYGVDDTDPKNMTDKEIEQALIDIRLERDRLRALETAYIVERVRRRDVSTS